MILDEITKKFLANPSYFRNGAGYLAKAFGVSREEIYEAKKKARELLTKNIPDEWEALEETPMRYYKLPGEEAEIHNCIAEQENVIVDTLQTLTNYIGSEQGEEGTTKKFVAQRNLSPEEIEKLAGVDGINTYVARVWEKLQPQGHWTYSIDVRYRVKDFYNAEQLKEKLAALMPDLTPVQLKTAYTPTERALVILLADDHAGAINKTNLFDNPDVSYEDRLQRVADEVLSLGESFEEVHIISLGDQMNGWNKQTTRGGHIVDSLPNEDQFDVYVSARVKFYDRIFGSGVGQSYFIHDVENSNHSGLGMSYMANKALEMYLDGKYPQVYRESIKEMIGGFQYGKHIILMGHGKDEKFQRRPMPANLDAKTDLYLYDYAQNKGYSPYNDHITFYKGDLHQLGFQYGKFGRYVNCPSVAGNSDYGDLNFGNTKGGALIEVLDKDSYRVITLPIWF